MSEVLILSASFEDDTDEAELLCEAVRDRGGTPIHADTTDWPGTTPVAARDDGAFRIGDHTIDPDTLTGAFVIPEDAFHPVKRIDADGWDDRPLATFFQLREYRSLFASMFRVLADEGVRLSCPPDKFRVHTRKLWQIRRFRDAGVPVPPTLATNDPDEAREFVERHGDVVAKAVAGGSEPHVLTPESLDDDRLERLANSPVQFQARVPGQDVRVYVVDGEPVAEFEYYHDREGDGPVDVDMEEVELADTVVEATVDATEALGLPFGAVDARWDGESLSVLEVNEAGRFGILTDRTGCDIAGPLADYLLGR